MVKPWQCYLLVVPSVGVAGFVWLQMPVGPTVLCMWDSHYLASPEIPLPRVNPKIRVNPRLKVSQVKPRIESPTYKAQLAIQVFAAT